MRKFVQFQAKKVKKDKQEFWKISFKGDGGLAHMSPVTKKSQTVKIFINIELDTQTGIVTQF